VSTSNEERRLAMQRWKSGKIKQGLDGRIGDIFFADGKNGRIELHETVVKIIRQGFDAFLTQGLKGDKEILISSVSSVQFKSADAFTKGYIQLAFLGGQEAKGGLFQSVSDENTVMFDREQEPNFEQIRRELMRRLTQANTAKSVSRDAHSLDDLEKLASFRDRGIITEEEFQHKKRQILGL